MRGETHSISHNRFLSTFELTIGYILFPIFKGPQNNISIRKFLHCPNFQCRFANTSFHFDIKFHTLDLCCLPSTKSWFKRQSCFLPIHSTVEHFCLFFGLAKKSTSICIFARSLFSAIQHSLAISSAQSTEV